MPNRYAEHWQTWHRRRDKNVRLIVSVRDILSVRALEILREHGAIVERGLVRIGAPTVHFYDPGEQEGNQGLGNAILM